jgi:hypothetical protein
MVGTVRMWVKGVAVDLEFPASMPGGIRVQVVRSALNGLYWKARQGGGGIGDPAAYLRGAVRKKGDAWGTDKWPDIGMLYLREAHKRRAQKTALDPVALVMTLRDDPRGHGRVQLAAVTGHDPACDRACRACRALDAGDWEAYADASGMDALTAEHAYDALADAGLVGPVRRTAGAAQLRRRAPVDPWAL